MELEQLDRDLLLADMSVEVEFGCNLRSCILVDKVDNFGCNCLGFAVRSGLVGSWDMMVADDTSSCSCRQQVLLDNLDSDKLDFHRQSFERMEVERKSWQVVLLQLVDGMQTNRVAVLVAILPVFLHL